jgi:predicted ATPase
VEGYFKFRPLGPQLVKGLDAPVPVFELVSANPVRSRLQASAASGLTSFVGRDEELDVLRTALDEARVGKGGVLAFVGEPGVGKSRLYREFTHSNRTDGALVLEAASVSFGKATPWLPVIDLLKTYFRLEPNEDPRAVREKVAAKLLSLDHRLAPVLPALLWLVDAAPDDPDWDRLDPAQRRRRLLKGVQQLLLRESRVQPVILVFEDLHWIDDETQALLDGIVDELPSARVLLLVNYRPSYSRPAWDRKAWHREHAIDPFREKKADEMPRRDPRCPSDTSAPQALVAGAHGGEPILPRGVRSNSRRDRRTHWRAWLVPTRPTARRASNSTHRASHSRGAD